MKLGTVVGALSLGLLASSSSSSSAFSAAFPATRVEGLVIEIESARGVVVVAHSPTKTMPAMTMPFRVSRAADLQGIQPGMRIRFNLKSPNRIAGIQKR